MKKNKFVLPLLLILGACGSPKKPQTLFSKLEVKNTPNAFLDRRLASGEATGCLRENFTVETLKAEIAPLEKMYSSGTKVEGVWKHLKLSELPIAQANFLKEYGEKIGDQSKADSIDYSGCKDVPCIFNRIYQKEDYIAGYMHYLWYLKFGHMLSADNHVYDQLEEEPGKYNGKKFPLSAYLYDEKELYAFWRLTKMLKDPYTNISSIVEVQRAPRGEDFDSVEKEKKEIAAEIARRVKEKLPTLQEENAQRRKNGLPLLRETPSNACGLAWSNGYVLLQDGCLKVNLVNDTGYFFEAVTHELTHQLDYFEGRTKYNTSYRSGMEDYYTIAGYKKTEYTKDGKLVTVIEGKPDIKLITIYAGTSLAENFAETLAYFRVDGKLAKEAMSTPHREFVAEKYFKKRYFDPQSLYTNWSSEYSSEIAQASFKAVGDCSKSTTPVASNYFTKNDFKTPLLPAMLSCLGKRAEDTTRELRAKVRANDPQGCQFLDIKYRKIEFIKSLRPHFVSMMGKYIMEYSKDKAYFAKVQSFYDQIPDRTMAGNAYVSCLNQEDLTDQNSCFVDETYRLAMDKIAPLNLPVEHAEELAGLYLDQHTFNDIKQHVETTYRAFVASHRQQVEDASKDLWDSCTSLTPDDVQPPTGTYFKIGQGYMVSSAFNCINAQFPTAVSSIVRSLSVDGQRIQHPNEEIIFTKEVTPEVQKMLLGFFEKESKDELEKINGLIPGRIAKARAELVSSFDWVKDVINNESTRIECEKKSLGLVPLEPMYNFKAAVYKNFATDVCRSIHESSEFGAWLESSKGEFESKAYSSLEGQVLTFAAYQAKECLKKFPTDTNLNRVKFKQERESCLVGQWYLFENSAFEVFEKDPLVIKFKIDSMPLRGRLESSRRPLQLKIMKEYF